jgi:hypothetical protein
MRNAYRACALTDRNKRCKSGRAVHVYRLVQDHNIRLPQTIEFVDPELDQDGILRLDLRTARISARSAARARRLKEKAAATVLE